MPALHTFEALVCWQTVLQAPQLFGSLAKTASQPVFTLPSQSPYSVPQLGTQLPFVQVLVPWGCWQAAPQAPQLPLLVLRFDSQPSLSSGPGLQSAKFAAHAASWQLLATHFPVALAYRLVQLTPFVPQPPQLAELVLVFVSQSVPFPSQSAQGAVQVATLHTWLTHFALALAMLQAVAQPPQLAASPAMFVSQPLATLPSQSAQPASQVPTLQADATHDGVACGTTQAEPQPPQLFTSVVVLVGQVPSAFGLQSPRPARQLLTPHTPAAHVAEPSVVGHTLPHAPQLLTSKLVCFSQPLTVSLSQSA